MVDRHTVGERIDSPIRPMGAIKRFFIWFLLTSVSIGAPQTPVGARHLFSWQHAGAFRTPNGNDASEPCAVS